MNLEYRITISVPIDNPSFLLEMKEQGRPRAKWVKQYNGPYADFQKDFGKIFTEFLPELKEAEPYQILLYHTQDDILVQKHS
jgi:hypothetical protein